MKLFLVFGNHLFPELEFKKYKNDHFFFMCESMQMCSKFNYHKKKLLFLLSSMRSVSYTHLTLPTNREV